MKRLTNIIVLIFLCASCFAQSGSDVDISPDNIDNNFDFEKNINKQIDYSTGILSPEFPLTIIRNSTDTVDIKVQYTSGSGIKVNDIADEVGLGFKLISGGSIKRILRGLPDEQDGGWLANNAVSSLKNSQLVNEYLGDFVSTNSTFSFSTYLNQVLNRGASPSLDAETDVYEYNIPGSSGFFFYNNNSEIILAPYNGLKIEKLSDSNGSFWSIKDDNGRQFIFRDNDSFRETTTQTTINSDISVPEITFTYTSEWNLSKIISENGDEINFSYFSSAPISYTIHDEAQNDFIDDGSGALLVWDGYGGFTHFDISSTITIRNKKSIANITTSFQNVEFEYNDIYNFPRKDIANARYLKRIISKRLPSNTITADYRFRYSYFNDGSSTSPESYRLKLNSITKLSLDQSAKDYQIKFEYENSYHLPERNSFKQDFWGYFNNNSSAFLIPSIYVYQHTRYFGGANRQIDEARTKADILNKIIFSAGYQIELSYQQNQISDDDVNPQINQFVGGLRIHSVVYKSLKDNQTLSSVELKYNLPSNPTISSGCISNSDFVRKGQQYNLTSIAEYHENTSDLIKLHNYVIRTGFPYKQKSFDYIRYSNVTIDYGDNGHVENVLTGFNDHPDGVPAYMASNGNSSPSIRALPSDLVNCPKDFNNDNSIERGLLLSVKTYDKYNILKQQKSYSYDFSPTTFNSQSIVNLRAQQRIRIIRELFDPGAGFYDISESDGYALTYYTLKSRWIPLVEQVVQDYVDGGIINNTTHFYYESSSHNKVTKISHQLSNNEYETKKYTYVNDFPSLLSTSCSDLFINSIKYMQEKGINKLIENVNLVGTVSTSKITSGKLFLYQKINCLNSTIANLCRNEYEIVARNSILESDFAYCTVFQCSLNYDNHYILSKSNDLFDSRGNVLQLHDRQSYTSFKFNRENIVNSIFINSLNSYSAQGNDCGYLDFESGQESASSELNDYWTVPTNSLTDNLPHTGKYCGIIPQSTGSIVFGNSREFLPTNQYQKFKFSAWIKTSTSFAISAGNLIIELYEMNGGIKTILPTDNTFQTEISSTNNEWVLKELNFDLGKYKNDHGYQGRQIILKCFFTNNDNSNPIMIDDVRFQPYYSKCNSFTFDEKCGKQNSVSDERSKPIFYTYDFYGRKLLTCNFDHSIIESRSYNDNDYEFCNSEEIVAVRRSDCGVTTSPSLETVIVPENTYCNSDHYEQIENQLNGFIQSTANANGTCGSCVGRDRKTISGVCELGVYEFVNCVWNSSNGRYYVTYRYRFSDNSINGDYTDILPVHDSCGQ